MTETERIQDAIRKLHHCESRHVESVPLTERFGSVVVWQGVVEVFDLEGHPKARTCYAWEHAEGADDKGRRVVSVLKLPPVTSPETAVRAAIVSESQRR